MHYSARLDIEPRPVLLTFHMHHVPLTFYCWITVLCGCALFQVELEPIRHRIYEEMVTQLHMSESFTTAHADTMRTVLDYVEDRYHTRICLHFFWPHSISVSKDYCHQLWSYVITLRPIEEQSIVMSMSVCLCVSLSTIISSELPVWSSSNFCAYYLWLWLGLPLVAQWYVTYFQFMDDVIFAHKLKLLDVATRLRQ